MNLMLLQRCPNIALVRNDVTNMYKIAPIIARRAADGAANRVRW